MSIHRQRSRKAEYLSFECVQITVFVDANSTLIQKALEDHRLPDDVDAFVISTCWY